MKKWKSEKVGGYIYNRPSSVQELLSELTNTSRMRNGFQQHVVVAIVFGGVIVVDVLFCSTFVLRAHQLCVWLLCQVFGCCFEIN